MSITPNLQDVADGFLANRATMPMVLVECIRSTYRRCQDEANRASDLRTHYREPDGTRLRPEAAESEAAAHEANYRVLCQMLGDQSRLLSLGFLTERPECGCPEVYADIDHAAMGDRIGPPWLTICKNPKCPGDKEVG